MSTEWDLTAHERIASGVYSAVRRLEEAEAAFPPNRNPHARRIIRRVVADAGLDAATLGAWVPLAEHALIESDLQGARLAFALAVLPYIEDAQGAAVYKRTTIRRVVDGHPVSIRGQRAAHSTSVAIARPRARGAGRPRARAHVRSSSRSGDSGSDEPGESEEDLEAPHCESCGAELVAPARLCGFCELEANLPPEHRACAICRCDIAGRRGDAETPTRCAPFRRPSARSQSTSSSVPTASVATHRWRTFHFLEVAQYSVRGVTPLTTQVHHARGLELGRDSVARWSVPQPRLVAWAALMAAVPARGSQRPGDATGNTPGPPQTPGFCRPTMCLRRAEPCIRGHCRAERSRRRGSRRGVSGASTRPSLRCTESIQRRPWADATGAAVGVRVGKGFIDRGDEPCLSCLHIDSTSCWSRRLTRWS